MRYVPTFQYSITQHSHLTGVRLSRAGQWGGLPFANADEAEQFARDDAGKNPLTIERAAFRMRQTGKVKP